jgi:hypothetical protein
MDLPSVTTATKLHVPARRLFVGAYGFEKRSLGWTDHQHGQGSILDRALVFRYQNPKGRNKTKQLRNALKRLGAHDIEELPYDTLDPGMMEDPAEDVLRQLSQTVDEIVVDITAQTKFLILLSLCMISGFDGTVRIVYSEAEEYPPTAAEYKKFKKSMKLIAKIPSRGFQSIARAKCLSSIRMQGQPVTLIAFTSFNEQLVRHMLGTISPHRLLFINGRPPRVDYKWREVATQEIHQKLIQEYSADNPISRSGQLIRTASTLNYKDTIKAIEEAYQEHGRYERIMCIATGSKMQTVAVFFSKVIHPDIHVEYPTPDSYFVKRMSNQNVRQVHEIVLPKFSTFLQNLRTEMKGAPAAGLNAT